MEREIGWLSPQQISAIPIPQLVTLYQFDGDGNRWLTEEEAMVKIALKRKAKEKEKQNGK